ncbi:hypothetical protein ACHWQZ_G011174 [Mnemiopsis leidyi]
MTESSAHIHDIFETEAADRDLPSPYMEKYFAKFEAIEIAKAEERIFACRLAIAGQIFFILFYFVVGLQLLCFYNYFFLDGVWNYSF